MRKTRGALTLPLGLLLFVVLACNYSASTANISGLKVGKDQAVNTETSSFGAKDTVYVIGTDSNAPDAVKVTGRLVIVDVAGQQAGPIPGLEKTLDLPGSGTATYTFTPPPSGWPAGKYRMEVLMLNEAGEQKDQKATDFTVS